MRVPAQLVALVAAGGVLTGCGSTPSPTAGPASAGTTAEPSRTSTAPRADARGLVGLWQVRDAGEPAGTVLRLATDGLALVRPCGVVVGQWDADAEGQLVAEITGGPAACRVGTELTPGWLVPPSGFRPEAAGGLVVHDREGTVVARLVPARRVTLPPGADPQLAVPPTLDMVAERRLRPAAPLPAGLSAASGRSLAGAWGPAPGTGTAGTAVLQLREDGRWSGSDGCNTTAGRWHIGSAGRLLVTAGPSTRVGCDGAPLPQWFRDAALAGLDGERLVLLDADAKELGRLVHVPTRPGASHGPTLSR